MTTPLQAHWIYRSPVLSYENSQSSHTFRTWCRLPVWDAFHMILEAKKQWWTNVAMSRYNNSMVLILQYTKNRNLIHVGKKWDVFPIYWVTVQKCQIRVKIGKFLQRVTLPNNSAPLILFQYFCIILQPPVNSTWVTVQKCPIQFKISEILSCITLIFEQGYYDTGASRYDAYLNTEVTIHYISQ